LKRHKHRLQPCFMPLVRPTDCHCLVCLLRMVHCVIFIRLLNRFSHFVTHSSLLRCRLQGSDKSERTLLLTFLLSFSALRIPRNGKYQQN
jgi:hypothetical protein